MLKACILDTAKEKKREGEGKYVTKIEHINNSKKKKKHHTKHQLCVERKESKNNQAL